MSKAIIDERVVEMKFDNKEFEKNIAQSLSTLDKLKAALNLKPVDSLKEIGAATKNFNMDGVKTATEECAKRFSAMEIAGITALANIANRAVNCGVQLVKSLSIAPIKDGFNEYEMKMGSIQTIMASTGESIQKVNGYLNELNTYSDKTIYSFADMTNNIGKFTNAGVKLDRAVKAIQGIANEAAVSGANANEASRAMYNFAQALSAGYVKLIDWKSIENANMATVEFKQQLLDTAEAMGTVVKIGDKYQTTTKDLQGKVSGLFDATHGFNDALSNQWMTTEVLSQTLENYATDTREMTEAEKDAWRVKMKSIGYTEQQINAIEKLGQKAFNSAQDVKTFSQLMDTLRESVGSGWAQTSEIIFGNLEEAKQLWTGISNVVGGFIGKISDARNNMLQTWKDLGGRTKLINSIAKLLNVIVAPLRAIGRALRSMLPSSNSAGKMLYNLTERFSNFVQKIQPTEKELTNIYLAFQGLFSVGKLVIDIITGVIHALFPATGAARSLLDIVLMALGKIGLLLTVTAQFIRESGVIKGAIKGIGVVVKLIVQILNTLAKNIGKVIAVILVAAVTAISKILALIGKLITKFSELNIVQKTLLVLQSIINKVYTVFSKFAETIGLVVPKMKDLNSAGKETTTIFDKIRLVLLTVVTVFKSIGIIAVGAVLKVVSVVGSLTGHVIGFFSEFVARFKEFDKGSSGIADHIKAIFETIKSFISDAKDKIAEFFGSLNIDAAPVTRALEQISSAFYNFTKSISIGKVIAVAFGITLLMLASNAVKLTKAFTGVTMAAKTMMTTVSAILKQKFMKATYMTEFAKTIAIIAGSLVALSMVPMDRLNNAALILGGFGVALVAVTAGFMGLAKKVDLKTINGSIRAISKSMILISGAMVMFAGAAMIMSKVTVGGTANLDEWISKLVVITGMVGILVGSIAAISMINKKIPQCSLMILSLAVSMSLLVGSLEKLSTVKADQMEKHWKGFILIFGGLSLMLAAAGKVKISAAVGLLLLSTVVSKVGPALTSIVDSIAKIPEVDKARIATIINSMTGLLQIILFINVYKDFMNVLRGIKPDSIVPKANPLDHISMFILSIGASMALIAEAVKTLTTIFKSNPELLHMLAVAATIAAIVAGVVLIFKVLSKTKITSKDTDSDLSQGFKRLAIEMFGIGAALLMITKAMEAIGKLPVETIAESGTVIAILIGSMAVMTTAMSKLTKENKTLGPMLAMLISIGAIIGEFAILSMMLDSIDPSTFGASIVALGIIVASISALSLSLSTIKDVKTGPVMALLGMIISLSGTMFVIAGMMENGQAETIQAAFQMVFTLLVTLTAMMGIIGSIGNQNLDTAPLLAMVGAIVAMGGSLVILAQYDWSSIIAAGGAMTIAIASIGVVLGLLSNFTNGADLTGTASGLAIVSAGMIALALACNAFNTVNWDSLLKGGLALTGIAVALGILGSLTVQLTVAATGMLLVSAAVGVLAVSLIALDQVRAEGIVKLAGVLLVLAAGIAGLGAIVTAFTPAMFTLIGVLISLDATIVIVSAALGEASPIFVKAGESIAGFFKGIIDWIKKGWESVKNGAANIVKKLRGLATDVKDALNPKNWAKTITQSCKIGEAIAGSKEKLTGFLGGLAEKLGWHSPPSAIAVDLNGDTQQALKIMGNDCASVAKSAGLQIGDNFGKGMFDSVKQAVGGLKSAFQGFSFDNIGKQFNGLLSKVTGTNSSEREKVRQNYARMFQGNQQMINDYMKKWDSKHKSKNVVDDTIGKAKDKIKGLTDTGDIFNDTIKKVETSLDGASAGFKNLGGGVGSASAALDGAGRSGHGAAKGIKAAGDAAKQSSIDMDEATKKLTELRDGFKNTVSNQMDMFNKMELKAELSPQALLENMRSNLEGVQKWMGELNTLVDRGITQELYKKLADLGPQGYETLHAFTQMTDEQLKQANDMFAQSLALPDNLADNYIAQYTSLGQNTVAGFVNGLAGSQPLSDQAITTVMQSSIDNARNTLGVHSPSTVFLEIGKFLIEGLRLGISDPGMLSSLTAACENICYYSVVDVFRGILTYDTFHEIGVNVSMGLANGISDSSGEAIAAAESLANQVAAIMRKALDIHSPSRVTRGIGRNTGYGFAFGIEDTAQRVADAAAYVADKGAARFNTITGRIQDAFSALDLNPVITPELDMSNVENQLGGLSASIRANKYGSYDSQNEGTGAARSINFTQNNYSPKALSRYEIYRNTQNQLSMLKGVLKTNNA